MKRLQLLTLILSVAWAVPAWPQAEYVNPIIRRLEAEGFTVSDVSRSWLGRILITAENDTHLREVVLNRTSGDVLRDKLFPHDGSRARPTTLPPKPGVADRPRPSQTAAPGPNQERPDRPDKPDRPGGGDSGPGPGGGRK